MAWSASGGFRQTFADALNNVVAIDLGLETHKAALFDNDITPDFDATAANSAYGAGQWVSAGNEVSGTGYAAGGVAVTTTAVTVVAGGIMMWDAADTAWAGATFSNAYGCLIYADALAAPVADQGICAVYFGGGYSVTAGTFTIQWHANGILRLDVA
jgi:hypothetical protein